MSGYACQFGDDHPAATVLITFLQNGATITVCSDDLAPALINVVAVDLGVDPTKFYEAVRRFVDREAKAAEKAAQQATSDDTSGGAASDAGEATGPDGEGHGGGGQDVDDLAADVGPGQVS